MTPEERFDDILRDKFGNRTEPAFNENAWQGASELLDQHYRSRFYKRIAAVIIPLLFVGGASALFYSDTATDEIYSPRASSEEAFNTPLEIIEKTPSSSSSNTFDKSKVASAQRAVALANNGMEEPSSQQSSNPVNSPIYPFDKSSNTYNNAFLSTDDNTRPTRYNESRSTLIVKEGIDLMPCFALGKLSLGSLSIVELNTDLEQPSFKSTPVFNLNAEGAFLASNGIENTGTEIGPLGYGGLIGLEANYFVSRSTYISSGLLIHSRGQLNSLLETKQQNILVEQTQLLYADIPVHLGFKLMPKTFVSMGLVVSPLIGGWVTPLQPQTELNNRFNRQGFATFDMGGSIHFKHMFGERLALSARFKYGLFDITDDQHFDTEAIDDRNHRINIGLNYRIFSR